MNPFHATIDRIRGKLIEFRHDLHAHPELAFEEHRTSARVVEELKKLPGLKIETGIAGTGVVATLNAGKPGKCVALRGDMDCLPIEEQNTFAYKSKHAGRMHACGHDGHTTCLLGAAMVLSEHADKLPGRVKFVFQPAEEGGGGGGIMVKQGILEGVDAAFALHGWPETKVGTVGSGAGPMLAATAEFDIEIRGRQAHAAYPQASRDPIVAAAYIVTALQTVVARSSPPLEPVVVSVCRMHGGTAYNIIPETATLAGTVRCYSTEMQRRTFEALSRVVESTAAAFGCQANVTIKEGYPAMVNDADCVALVNQVAADLLGPDNVEKDPPRSLGGEDFAYFAEKVPSGFWRLGVCPADRDDYPKLHQPLYDFNDDAIPIGVAMHCEIARRFLVGRQHQNPAC